MGWFFWPPRPPSETVCTQHRSFPSSEMFREMKIHYTLFENLHFPFMQNNILRNTQITDLFSDLHSSCLMKESWLTGEFCYFQLFERGNTSVIFRVWSCPNNSQETAIQDLVVLPVFFNSSFFANIVHAWSQA